MTSVNFPDYFNFGLVKFSVLVRVKEKWTSVTSPLEVITPYIVNKVKASF